MVIRTMQMGDYNPVVDIHLRFFKGFFLTFLGPSFLTLLYQATLTDASGIVLVAEVENGHIEEMAGVIQRFYCAPEWCAEQGANGRCALEKNFSRSACVTQFRQIVLNYVH